MAHSRWDRIQAKPVVMFATVAIRIFNEQRVMGLAQQIAYNILFSVAPLLIFLTAFGGLVVQRSNSDMANPVQPVLDWTNEQLPAEAAALLREPIEAALSTDPGYLLSIGGVLALWSAKNAIASIMSGLNATYGIRQNRPFIANNVVAILLTIGLAVAIVVAAGIRLISTTVGEDVVEALSLGSGCTDAVARAQIPVTVVMVLFGVTILHRFGPTFNAPFLWYLPGALVTIVGILVAIAALQIYFEISAGFAAAYGVFGAVLAFIFWMFVVGLVILIGGIVNATLFEIYPPAMRALAEFRVVEQERAEKTAKLKVRVKDALSRPDQPSHESPIKS